MVGEESSDSGRDGQWMVEQKEERERERNRSHVILTILANGEVRSCDLLEFCFEVQS